MKTLRKLIHQNMLINSLVPIFIIEIALLLMYFMLNQHLFDERQDAVFGQVVNHLQSLTEREAVAINLQLQEVSRLGSLLQLDHERFFRDLQQCQIKSDLSNYAVHENGAFYKVNNNGGASLYYSSITEMDERTIRKAVCSERMDPMLRRIVDSNPIITQAYINTWDTMNRLYPFISNSPKQFGPSMDTQIYNFYYLADQIHNPEKRPVWTSAYLDPAGQGWVISNIFPIYKDGFLEGVSGLDVTIEVFINKILNIELPWQASTFLVDSNGVVLAMQKETEKLLGLRELTNHQYKHSIPTTIEKPEQFRLIGSSNETLSSLAKSIFLSDNTLSEEEIGGHNFFISSAPIEQTGWHLVALVNKSALTEPVMKLRKQSFFIGWLAISFMIFFYFIFFVYLNRKSYRISKRIADPIEVLSQKTTDLKEVMKPSYLKPAGISEIDRLIQNFNSMGEELETRSRALITAEIRQQEATLEKNALRELASTDPLTGLANRRRAEEAFEQEINRSLRYNHPFVVIIADIDYFKHVNDTHGHEIGDTVLKEIANIFSTNIRKGDLVGRWGGEEFIFICTQVSEIDNCSIAENLRLAVESHNFHTVGRMTASFGVTEFRMGDTLATLLSRADEALYQAKKAGRNHCSRR